MNDKEASIVFHSEDISFELDNTEGINRWLQSIVSNESKELGFIEYVFCSDGYLLDVNVKHLEHDYYTDIITFPLSVDPIEATIFISIDRVNDNAERFNATFFDELCRVMSHGLLHMMGYNDTTNEEKSEMRAKENEYLSLRKHFF